MLEVLKAMLAWHSDSKRHAYPAARFVGSRQYATNYTRGLESIAFEESERIDLEEFQASPMPQKDGEVQWTIQDELDKQRKILEWA